MIRPRPRWKHPLIIVLLVALAAGLGAWLAMGRPAPEGLVERSGLSELQLPDWARDSEPDRLYCAESPDTGICACITASGERPEIGEDECRRRARASDTEPPPNEL
ncbi:hypothetical protein [Wenzhouxiangella marina]|uniref:Uncharacterized protein n=1 Tax=Wenzhouxiangella marina TaxID=1579979 RepID=A0A0K0XT67_9GAMM|nr:hypothetical protein [Wenzhouxiangella marina]AKS40909.1 hypothetical protein WM2015_527 [Wenzhouxiangella marina]MBB6087783.1 hypothetical protein [Wenzhouxiangella marina]